MTYTNKRAWLYSRIDAPEDTNGVLKNQEKELCDYAVQMGMTVAGTSSDLGSGLDYERPGLKQITAAAKDGRFDILLVKSLSRLGRDMEQTGELIKTLHEQGVGVCSPLEGAITLDSSLFDPYGIKMKQGGLT